MKRTAEVVMMVILIVANMICFKDRCSVDASCKKKSCKKQIVAIETKKTIPVPYPVPVVVHKTKYKTRYKPGKAQVVVAQIQRKSGCGCNNCCPIPIPIPVPGAAPTIMPSTTIDYADVSNKIFDTDSGWF